MKKERNSNFELMRIISMLFIVYWHMYIFGFIRDNNIVQNGSIKIIIDFLQFIFIVHVNSFILVTGYFSWNKKIKINKIVSIIQQSLFYKILIIIILTFLGIRSFTSVDIIKNLFPFEINLDSGYWFVRYYIYLYMLIPFINLLIKNLTKKNYKRLLILLLFIFSFIPFITGTKSLENNGYTLYQFFIIYLIGAYIGKYGIRKSIYFKNKSTNLYRLILVSIFTICTILNFTVFKTTELLMNYNSVFNEVLGNLNMMHDLYCNPIVIVQSVSYILLFETFDFKSKFINNISKLTLGIYLIHNNYYLRYPLFKFLKINGGPYYSYKFLLYYLIIGLVVFICCAIIEYIRQIVFKFLYKRKISKKIRDNFYSFLESFYIKEDDIK